MSTGVLYSEEIRPIGVPIGRVAVIFVSVAFELSMKAFNLGTRK